MRWLKAVFSKPAGHEPLAGSAPGCNTNESQRLSSPPRVARSSPRASSSGLPGRAATPNDAAIRQLSSLLAALSSISLEHARPTPPRTGGRVPHLQGSSGSLNETAGNRLVNATSPLRETKNILRKGAELQP